MKKYGFTLIELIVVMAIIALVMGGGLASYSTLGSQQKLTNETRKLRSTFETAKRLALSGDGSDICEAMAKELHSFQIEIDPVARTGGEVYLKRICDDPADPNNPQLFSYDEILTYTIDESTPVQPPQIITVDFQVQTGNATFDPPNTSTVTLKTASNKTGCIHIYALGIIDEGQNNDCLP